MLDFQLVFCSLYVITGLENMNAGEKTKTHENNKNIKVHCLIDFAVMLRMYLFN